MISKISIRSTNLLLSFLMLVKKYQIYQSNIQSLQEFILVNKIAEVMVGCRFQKGDDESFKLLLKVHKCFDPDSIFKMGSGNFFCIVLFFI